MTLATNQNVLVVSRFKWFRAVISQFGNRIMSESFSVRATSCKLCHQLEPLLVVAHEFSSHSLQRFSKYAMTDQDLPL